MRTFSVEATVNDDGKVILSLPFPRGQRVKIDARPTTPKNDDTKARFAAIDAAVGMLGTDGSLVRMLLEERKSEEDRDDHAVGTR